MHREGKFCQSARPVFRQKFRSAVRARSARRPGAHACGTPESGSCEYSISRSPGGCATNAMGSPAGFHTCFHGMAWIGDCRRCRRLPSLQSACHRPSGAVSPPASPTKRENAGAPPSALPAPPGSHAPEPSEAWQSYHRAVTSTHEVDTPSARSESDGTSAGAVGATATLLTARAAWLPGGAGRALGGAPRFSRLVGEAGGDTASGRPMAG